VDRDNLIVANDVPCGKLGTQATYLLDNHVSVGYAMKSVGQLRHLR
jgi:hypothetical protein